jgi:hypothetical protein
MIEDAPVTLISADIERARLFWREHLPRRNRRYAKLLDAGVVPTWEAEGWEPGTQPPAFVYVRDEGHYVETATGGILAWLALRRVLDGVISSSADLIKEATRNLIAGNIDLAQWQAIMMDAIKSGHITAAALAAGGYAELLYGIEMHENTIVPQAAIVRNTETEVKRQYGFLAGFLAVLAAGTFIRAVSRAILYPNAARGWFHQVERFSKQLQGYEEERRVLGIAEHCDDCPKLAGFWAPIGTLPPLGDSECTTHCKCHFRYRERMADGTWRY